MFSFRHERLKVHFATRKKSKRTYWGLSVIIKVSLDHLKNRNFGVNLTSKLSLAVTRSRSNWFRRGSKINEIYRASWLL